MLGGRGGGCLPGQSMRAVSWRLCPVRGPPLRGTLWGGGLASTSPCCHPLSSGTISATPRVCLLGNSPVAGLWTPPGSETLRVLEEGGQLCPEAPSGGGRGHGQLRPGTFVQVMWREPNCIPCKMSPPPSRFSGSETLGEIARRAPPAWETGPALLQSD